MNAKIYFNCKKKADKIEIKNLLFTCLIFSIGRHVDSRRIFAYVAWIHVGSSSEPVIFHVLVTHVTSEIRSSFFSALHFSLPVVSSPRLYPLARRFAKQVLLYSGCLLCNLLFSSKGEGCQKWSFVKWEKRDREARSHRLRRCDYHTGAGFIVRSFLSQFRSDDEKRDLGRRSFCKERIKPFIQRQRAIVRQRVSGLFL